MLSVRHSIFFFASSLPFELNPSFFSLHRRRSRRLLSRYPHVRPSLLFSFRSFVRSLTRFVFPPARDNRDVQRLLLHARQAAQGLVKLDPVGESIGIELHTVRFTFGFFSCSRRASLRRSLTLFRFLFSYGSFPSFFTAQHLRPNGSDARYERRKPTKVRRGRLIESRRRTGDLESFSLVSRMVKYCYVLVLPTLHGTTHI